MTARRSGREGDSYMVSRMRRSQMMWVRNAAALAVGVVLSMAACGGSRQSEPAAPAPAPSETLYVRLGGLEAITAVVHDFVANCAADARINAFFVNTDVPKLERLLVEQICQATGGPCTYTGRDMVTTHTGMKITDAQFDALVEDLVISLDKFKVPEREKNELLGALGGMRGDIVGK
jgi:hemoglobin